MSGGARRLLDTSARLVLAAGVAIGLGLAASGCAVNPHGPPHPPDVLDYPVGVTAGPTGRYVWVTSGNFDLAYGGGAVLALDVLTDQFVPGAAAEVGSFPGAVALRAGVDGALTDGYVLSRETNGLYHLRYGVAEDGSPTVTCEGGVVQSNGTTRCLDTQVEYLDVPSPEGGGAKVRLKVGPDPVGLLLHPARATGTAQEEPELLLSGAMVDGTAATFTLGDDGAPELVGNADLDDGLYAFAEHPQTGRVYASSKSLNALQVLELKAPAPTDAPSTNPYLHSLRHIAIPDALSGDRARELAFAAEGTRLLATYRSPATLAVFDVSADGSGNAADAFVAKIPVGARPGGLAVAHATAGAPELAYVACFGADRVDVVDPALGAVVDSIPTGHGPFGVAVVDNPALGIRRLYVTEFYEQAVGVIELDPASPYYHQLIAEVW